MITEENLIEAKKIIIRDIPPLGRLILTYPVVLQDAETSYFDGEKIVISKKIQNDDVIHNIIHEAKHIMLNHIRRGMEINAHYRNWVLWNIAADIIVETTSYAENLPYRNIFSTFKDILNKIDIYSLSDCMSLTAEIIYSKLLKLYENKKTHIEPISGLLPIIDLDVDKSFFIQFNDYMKGIGILAGDKTEEYNVLKSKFNLKRYISNEVANQCIIGNEPRIKIPHRKQFSIGIDYILEGEEYKKENLICLCVDTSGSISKEEFGFFVGCIENIGEIYLILFDAKVQYAGYYREGDKIPFKGRDGTNLNKAIEYIKNNKELLNNISVICVLTDGFVPTINTYIDKDVLVFYTDIIPRLSLRTHRYKFYEIKIVDELRKGV